MKWFVLGLVCVNLTLCVVHSLMASKCRRMIRGHREASRNRDDSDFATAAAAQSAAIGEASGTATCIGLTETTADVPIIAYKCAALIWRPGGLFALASYGGFTDSAVQTDADARCLSRTYDFVSGRSRPALHEAPGVSCKCGFYAVRTVDEARAAGYGLVTLDVELSGRVVVHERGYRAQHQRVLRVHLPRCWFCGDEASVVEVVADSTPPAPRPLCAAHAAHGDITVPIDKVMSEFGLPWEREEVQA